MFLMAGAVRLLIADILSRGSSLHAREAALKLVPGNVAYVLAVADLDRQQGADPRASLAQATAADPENYRLYVLRGIEAERAGDYSAASACLTKAARLSREFTGWWTLANYYFRRGDTPQFLIATRQALDVAPPDPSVAFHLLWNSGADPLQIAAAIPQTQQVLVSYLWWLTGNNQLDTAQPVAATVAARFPEAGRDALLHDCDLLASGDEHQRNEAADLWNTLVSRKILQENRLFPAAAPEIVDPGFRDVQQRLAFGWRTANDQIPIWNGAHGLTINFDGNEPERCDIVVELLSLQPEHDYTVECRYAGDIPQQSGLSWAVEDVRTRRALETSDASLNGSARALRFHFHAAENCRFARLTLRYGRRPGTVRLAGSLRIENMTLEPADAR